MTIVTATTELVATMLYLQRIRIFVVTSGNMETCQLRCSLPCRLFSTQNQFETHPLRACWKMNMCMYIYIYIYLIIYNIYNIIYVDSYNWLHWILILYCQIEDTGELIKSHLTSRPLKWHLHGMRLPSNSVLWTTVVSRDLRNHWVYTPGKLA